MKLKTFCLKAIIYIDAVPVRWSLDSIILQKEAIKIYATPPFMQLEEKKKNIWMRISLCFPSTLRR